jgi:hypothetical protein
MTEMDECIEFEEMVWDKTPFEEFDGDEED